MTRVLVAMDGSPESAHAAATAVDLFGPTAEYLVANVAQSVYPLPDGVTFGAVYPMSGSEWTNLVDAADHAATATAARGAASAGIDEAEIIVEHGDVVGALCLAAEAHSADVIVVGSHDKSWIGRLISPSVADGIAHRSPRPVLVVSGE
ncbi:MAG: universal stress protein [Acidimicrobiia bacterium]|nr:universal stress protein [Acidimicrobiia bacterium]